MQWHKATNQPVNTIYGPVYYQNKSGTNSEIQTKTNEKLNTETRLTSQRQRNNEEN